MRKAQAITDAGFAFIVDFIEPGMTEAQVQRALDNFMLDAGAEGLAFPTIVATGAHAASPHALSGDTRIAYGSAIVNGFRRALRWLLFRHDAHGVRGGAY